MMEKTYEVTKCGKVFSLTNWRGCEKRELVQQENAFGYLTVRLTLNGVRKKFRVHRLVADMFLSTRPSSQHQIRHLDGNKKNNHYQNLKWGTAKENAEDRDSHGKTKRRESHNMAKLNWKLVDEIREKSKRGVRNVTLAAEYNVTANNIRSIKNNVTWKK